MLSGFSNGDWADRGWGVRVGGGVLLHTEACKQPRGVGLNPARWPQVRPSEAVAKGGPGQ